ncbi:MAG: hypothetical protein HOG34_10760, partial [Bacteroidetes bacterium]|nr:hypothetical protein [Bacteroidota bacterium]
MATQQLLDEILQILHSVKEDQNKLQQILLFLRNEVYPEQEESEIIEIPEKYKKVIPGIADSIDAGLVCFLNLDTLETEDISQSMIEDPDDFEAITGESFETLDLKNPNWDNCISFEPLDSHDSFKIMEYFADDIMDNSFQNKLINALSHKKPFANFKAIVENSHCRQD